MFSSLVFAGHVFKQRLLKILQPCSTQNSSVLKHSNVNSFITWSFFSIQSSLDEKHLYNECINIGGNLPAYNGISGYRTSSLGSVGSYGNIGNMNRPIQYASKTYNARKL